MEMVFAQPYFLGFAILRGIANAVFLQNCTFFQSGSRVLSSGSSRELWGLQPPVSLMIAVLARHRWLWDLMTSCTAHVKDDTTIDYAQ